MEAKKLNGKVAEGTKTSGEFFRVWMDVKAALTGNNHNAISNSCDYVEDEAIDMYVNAIENDLAHLSAEQQRMNSGQKSSQTADHNHVAVFLDALVDA